MRLCITSSGSNLDSLVDPRFGRCLYFIFINSDDFEEIEVVKNEGINAIRGAGVQSAQTVIDHQAEAVITGNIGPNSFFILNSSKIKIFQSPSGEIVKKVISLFKEGKLIEIEESGANGFGRGFGRRGR